MKFAIKLIRHYPPYLRHYLGKLKIKFSADVEKIQTNCIFNCL